MRQDLTATLAYVSICVGLHPAKGLTKLFNFFTHNIPSMCQEYSVVMFGLGVTFPPHYSSDAGSNPAEVVEFLIQGTSPPGGTLSCLTRVVNLLHVKEPQAPRGL
jgi:hypothetical protein